MSRFFIDRPIFAWVLAIVVMLAGVMAVYSLPTQQYPDIAPPSVTITATLPGASAETMENSVTQVLEQQLKGIDHLRYFRSESTSNGTSSIVATFEPNADPDIAQVQVQNKIQAAMTILPQEVQAQGVFVNKVNDAFLLVAAFYTDDGSMTELEISDLVSSRITDEVARASGVGNVITFGPAHAMRIWLDPHKLVSYSMTANDVRAAIIAQNSDVSAGQLGALPAVKGQQLNATISAQSRLRTPEQFENILLRVNTDGSQVRLRDVARVELGASDYQFISRFMGKPAAGLAVNLATGANALETARLVRERIDSLKSTLPPSLKVSYPYDTTPFVKLSINSVVKTLIEAVILVFGVMYLFLQNFRATLIPSIAVPVVLLGTFAVLFAFGYSINTLTMFAMVLAIGLLVDDAIVVVENVERVMEEEGLPPREATRKSMDQISGALVGIALVLSAVFVPMAFFPGSTGIIYRQFSITIVSAMTLSVFVALILTPSLCATLLKPKQHKEATTGFFGWFNRNFNRGRDAYATRAQSMTQRAGRFFVIYALLLAVLALLFFRLPGAFLPDEDQGIAFVMINSPAGATAERTLESVIKTEQYLLNHEKETVADLFTVVGFGFAGSAQNSAMGFINLVDWDKRGDADQSVFTLVGRTMMALAGIKDASVFAMFPPAISSMGNSSGFDVQLLDRGGLGHAKLLEARNQLLGMAAQNPKLMGVRPNGLEDVAELKLEIDYEKASALGISVADINATLQQVWGSSYVNDFIDKGRVKRVYVQADAPYRMKPEDVALWHVRNANGDMVPFSSFSHVKWDFGSPKLERFNGVSSMNIQGAAAPGVSSGEAMAEIEQIIRQLPEGIGYEWTGLSYEERLAGSQAPLLYALSLLIVFLCLAALYESWSVPFSVMLVVPLGVIGAVVATLFSGLSNDVYFQVGLLTTIGLSAKNAILIVEFAKEQYEHGMSLMEATMTAARQRFRPIMMTSLAFILGVMPMALASGAGSASQNAIGIGVVGGMLAATFLAIFFVPLFYISVQRLSKRNHAENDHAQKN
jgi:multidrug efflux pump